MASAFGAAGSLVLVMVWVYYSAQIFLFGAEFTWVYANTLRLAPGRREEGRHGARRAAGGACEERGEHRRASTRSRGRSDDADPQRDAAKRPHRRPSGAARVYGPQRPPAQHPDARRYAPR